MEMNKYKYCHNCGQPWSSMQDKKYIDLFDQCWDCDQRDWKDGILSLEEFEERERKSLDQSLEESLKENEQDISL